MLQTLHPMGQGWRHAADARSTSPTSGTGRKNRSIRMLHRRHFRSGEKGGSKVGKTKRGKGTKLMVITDAHGLPLAVHTASASPHEVTLVEATLDEAVTLGRPRRLIGDRAYDSDPLDQRLAERGIELIAPHRKGRIRPATQDGRALRRYRRRWKVERTFAWLNKFKRVITRWDRCIEHYTAFVHLSLAMILLRRHL
jgi:transposase